MHEILKLVSKERSIINCSEKAKIFCEISTVDLFYVVMVKCTVEILQNFVAFSEYTNFNIGWSQQPWTDMVQISVKNLDF